MSIISFDLPNARHRSRSPQRCRVLVVQPGIDRPSLFIDRPSLLSIARHYYRLPAIIIDCPSLLSIARHYYR
ncbi:hypothetical protein, partial [Microcoleus sp.]|uniref:hypothetical protein n=1 Tax=Microcoleus sp. TaxID=44472 RepID=UPI00403E5A9F